MQHSKANAFSEPRRISHRQNDGIDRLKQGEIEDIRISQERPVDQLATGGFLKLLGYEDRAHKTILIEVLVHGYGF